jgi:hypothetical protein
MPAPSFSDPAHALGDCLGQRIEAARQLALAISAGDPDAAAAQHGRVGRLSASLPDLQQRLGPSLASAPPELLSLIRALAAEVKSADAAVSRALATTGSSSLPLWLLAHGHVTDAALDALLAPPWDKNRDLVALSGLGSWAVGQALLGRGQNRVLVVDPGAPETPIAEEEPDAALWNLHTQAGLEAALGSMTWPLPAQLRIVEIGPSPPFTSADLRGRLQAALEFSSVGQLQLLEEARVFALKATRNLAAITRTPSIAALRGALAGLPAVVVSAGPSLDKNLHVLKQLAGRVVIVAINQTVAGLRRAGIRADLVVAVDPLNISYHFEGTRPGDIGTLLLGASVDPALFKVPCDRVVHFSASPIVERWMYDFLGEDAAVSSDGTVSTGAIKLCAYLGCTTIISIGRDLALAGDKYYAASAADGGGTVTLTGDGRQISFGGYASRLRLGDGGDTREIQQMLDGQVYELREVPGFYGQPVRTTNLFVHEIERLRRTVAELGPGIRFINATEGGAYLAGMEHMTLDEAARQIDGQACQVDQRLEAPFLAAQATITRDRLSHMTMQLADLVRDLHRMESLAREASSLVAVGGGDAEDRSARVAADLGAISRARPFLSAMVQRATRAIVKKGGPAFATGDDVAAAERVLYAAIISLVQVLAPQVESAVADLRPGLAANLPDTAANR